MTPTMSIPSIVNNNGSREPFVTVLMPVYNSARYLADAITSILNQTYGDFELLIMDNASTDESPAIIQSFKEPRIRYVRNESNLGLAGSLNRGVTLSRGKYIARMDADDRSRPHRLQRQVSFMEKNPGIGICGGNILKHLNNRRYHVEYPQSHADIRATQLFHSGFAHPTVMMRREVLENNRLNYNPEFKNIEDYELWVRLIEKTESANLPDILLDYQCHDQQLSAENYRLMIHLSRIVHADVLRKLIHDVTDQDVNIHIGISLSFEKIDAMELKKTEAWLIRLEEANRERAVYEPRSFHRIISQKWRAQSGQASHKGFSVYRHYLRSPLSRGNRLSIGSFKLLAKCLLRK